MDPTANAREQWEVIRAAEQARAYEPRIPDTLRDRLHELRDALAGWRSRGGFAPEINPPTAEQCARAFGRSGGLTMPTIPDIWHDDDGVWREIVDTRGRRVLLGPFATEEDAERAAVPTAYLFAADLYCPQCIAAALAAEGFPVAPGEIDHAAAAETMLDELAQIRGIDRADEATFDSGDFPKRALAHELRSPADYPMRDDDGGETADRCGNCSRPLIEED